MKTRKNDVCLLYSDLDQTKAEQLEYALNFYSIEVWKTQNIPIGNKRVGETMRVLEQARIIIVLWSNNSVKSGLLKQLASEAKEKKKVLIFVLLDNVQIPGEFRDIQPANLRNWNGDQEDDQIIKLWVLIRDPVLALHQKRKRVSQVRSILSALVALAGVILPIANPEVRCFLKLECPPKNTPEQSTSTKPSDIDSSPSPISATTSPSPAQTSSPLPQSSSPSPAQTSSPLPQSSSPSPVETSSPLPQSSPKVTSQRPSPSSLPPETKASPQDVKSLLKTLLNTKKCQNCNLSGIELSDENLNGADLRGANLTGAKLGFAKLVGADLRGATLRGTSSCGDLSAANLSGADLRGFKVPCSGVKLQGANFRCANLQGADLSKANLSGADFTGVDLSEANLSYADTSGAEMPNNGDRVICQSK
jgi:hypothetical protein